VGATDLAIAIPIVLAATAVLVRSFRRKGGACAGCSGGACGKGPPARDVVPLGRPRRG
jgi:hypothetical protein